MPLPDASKKSPRVYTLLQNTDLDSVTFDNVQAVGNPIAIEEKNEDEMRRLVLVNLCRLVTSGEWSGLLSAGGGGGGFAAELTQYNWDGDGDRVRVMALPPYGNGNERTLAQTLVNDGQLFIFPFIAPTSGTISAVDFYCSTSSGATGAYNVGFYSDLEGVPQTLLGEFVMPTTSTGDVEQTTSSEDVVTVRGTQYWVGFYGDNLASNPQFAGLTYDGMSSALCVGAYGSTGILNALEETGGSSGNATITDWTLFGPVGYPCLNLGVTW